MGDANPICTLGDYSKPSNEGYRNTIELPEGNNVVPLRSDTIRLVQNGCSFHELQFEDPNKHFKDFLKLVDSLDLNGKDEAKEEGQNVKSSTTEFEDHEMTVIFDEKKLGIIMEYLVKISKKARILELKQRQLKITVLTSNTPYPSRKIRRIRACTSQKTTKINTPYPGASIRRIQGLLYTKILKDIKRGPYSKKSPIRRIPHRSIQRID
ncbi:hypothetical protein Tco_0115784 [Tanacetum coccineum]